MKKKTPDSKTQDPYLDIRNLFALFDQTRDAIVYASELEMRQVNINFSYARVLFILTQEKTGITNADLAHRIFRKAHTVSTLIIKMEKSGLVKRTRNKKDGKVYITITRKGLDLWDRINDRAIMLTFSALSAAEKEQFRESLVKLRTSVRDLLGLDYKPPFLF